MIHLSEGIDEPSRAEFDSLVNNQLLIDELIVIHGTALTATEFSLMAQVDASLVWSPMSNLLLYGDTADIAAADDAGVSISISPDWAPSGAKNVLHEVKIADWWDTNVLGDRFSDFEMAQMLSTNSVDQVAWTDHVGRIKPGLAADFLVLDSFESNPYRNLIEAVDPDVRLVVVGGLPVFGDVDLMQIMTNDTEIISAPDFVKGIDIRFDGVPSGTQTYAVVEQKLRDCLEDLSIGPRPFDPWYTFGDDRYFDVLNRSLTFQNGRSVDLWSDYYDINLDSNGNRTSVESSDPSTWTGGGSNNQTSDSNDSSGNEGDEVQDLNNSISIDELPILWPTFGPFGGEQHPSNSSFEQGIHIEECTTISQIKEDGKVRGCGAVVVLIQESTGCFVESESSVEYLDICPEDSVWDSPHPEISESFETGNWPVSRLDPSYLPGDVITFPGMTCADPIVAQTLHYTIITDDAQIGQWECRQAMNWINKIDSNTQSDDSLNSEQLDESLSSSLTGEVWYWFAIVFAFAILSVSAFVIVRSIKK